MVKKLNSVILIIHCAPLSNNAWQAWRVCHSLCTKGYSVLCFFDQAGVAHANKPGVIEPGTENLYSAYTTLSDKQLGGLQLQVCRAAWARRQAGELEQPWAASGLVELADATSNAKRILTFI